LEVEVDAAGKEWPCGRLDLYRGGDRVPDDRDASTRGDN
jgi:hypothetical protein